MASAYDLQFVGRVQTSLLSSVWTLMHPSSANFLLGWLFWIAAWLLITFRRPHDPLCQFCRSQPETGLHIFLTCQYAPSLAPGTCEEWSNTYLPACLGHLSDGLVVRYTYRSEPRLEEAMECYDHACLVVSLERKKRAHLQSES